MAFLELSNGVSISYQKWGSGTAKVLCLHGWMDNSNSFAYLGPTLVEDETNDFEIIAVDLVGHGFSSHLGFDVPYQLTTYVFYTKLIIDALKWTKSSLIGHSLGGNIALLFAGCYPKLVERLVLLDSFGPLVTKPDRASCESLRRAIDATVISMRQHSTARKTKYDSLALAAQAREKAMQQFPGNLTISFDAALKIVMRGVTFLEVINPLESAAAFEEVTNLAAGPVYFRHDPRLRLPSSQYFTEEQFLSYIEAVEAHVLVVGAIDGYPIESTEKFEKRKAILNDKNLLKYLTAPGSHHFHLDPDTAPNVARIVAEYLLLGRYKVL